MGLFDKQKSEEVAFTVEILKEFGESAVQIANEEFDINLDFSPESLSKLEKTISEKFPNPSATEASSEEQMKLVVAFGSYVGEVLARNLDGKWEITPFTKDEWPHALMEKVTMNVGPLMVFPFAKLWKRFAYGEEDSLTSYYDYVVRTTSVLKKP